MPIRPMWGGSQQSTQNTYLVRRRAQFRKLQYGLQQDMMWIKIIYNPPQTRLKSFFKHFETLSLCITVKSIFREETMIICLPCLGVQSEIWGVLKARTDQDGRVEAVGFGHLQCFPFCIAPIQIFPDPINSQGAGHRCPVDNLVKQRGDLLDLFRSYLTLSPHGWMQRVEQESVMCDSITTVRWEKTYLQCLCLACIQKINRRNERAVSETRTSSSKHCTCFSNHITHKSYQSIHRCNAPHLPRETKSNVPTERNKSGNCGISRLLQRCFRFKLRLKTAVSDGVISPVPVIFLSFTTLHDPLQVHRWPRGHDKNCQLEIVFSA